MIDLNYEIHQMVREILGADLQRLRARQAFYYSCAGAAELTAKSREASAIAAKKLGEVVAKLEEVRAS